MIIDTSFNLLTGLGITAVTSCPSCGDEDSQAGITVTIEDEVADDVSAQPSGR